MEYDEIKCEISDSIIEYKCDKDKKDVYIEYNYIDPNIPKSYFVILRAFVDKLTNKGYKRIIQSVAKEEWEQFLQCDKKWKIVEKIENKICTVYVIECKIEDYLGCVARGLGCDFIKEC